MRSKRNMPWLTLSLLLMFSMTTSCSYFFDQKENHKNSYNLTVDEKTGVSCVKKNNDLIRDYFNMKRDDGQIAVELREMKGCIRDTVDLFVKHTQTSSENQDTYSAKDLHEFLASIFDSYDFVQAFMEDAFILKDSLIGGGQFKISKNEVSRLPDFVDYFYEGLATLSVERHVLFNTDVHGKDWEKFAPAANKLMAIAKGAKKLNLKSSGDFDYQGAVRVVMYFIKDPEDKIHWAKSFNLINSMQALISSGKNDHLDMTKFQMTLEQLANLYLAYSEYSRYLQDEFFYKDMATILTFPALVNRAVEDPSSYGGNNPAILNSVQKKILSVLAVAADAAPKGKLSLDYIDNIILTLKNNDSLPSYINPETIKAMVPQFFNVWLSPNGCTGDACFARFANSKQIQQLQTLLDRWKERQLWINANLERRKSSASRTGKEFKTRSTNSNIASLQAAALKVNHAHWEGKYLIIGNKELTFKDMVVFHNIYTLAELFLRPFNNNEKKEQLLSYYLDRDQALVFYQWFRMLGLELKLVDPRSGVDSTAAFTEINMFGSTAVEPDKLDLAELIEYFEISISTSFRAVDLMNNQFVKCRLPRVFDVFNFQKLEALCFRDEWFSHNQEYLLSSFPRLNRYLKTINDSEYKEFLNSLEKASRQGLIVNDPVETDSIRQMSSILQYAESLFTRFDKDDNDVISVDELRLAMQHIVPNIKGIVESSQDSATVALLHKAFKNFEEDLLTYILAKHELPKLLTGETISGALIDTGWLKQFGEWSNSKEEWLNKEARVNRNDVLLVISGLSSLSRVSKIKKLKKHFYKNELAFQEPLKGPKDPLLPPIVKELGCSYKVEQDLYQWLYENQKRYWNDTLDFVSPGTFVLFGWDVASLGISWNDIPEINDIEIKNVPIINTDIDLKGFTKGWESQVVYKLIDLVAHDPKLGPLCGVPYIPAVHRIALQQDYKQFMCERNGTPVIGLIMAPNCRVHYRLPY